MIWGTRGPQHLSPESRGGSPPLELPGAAWASHQPRGDRPTPRPVWVAPTCPGHSHRQATHSAGQSLSETGDLGRAAGLRGPHGPGLRPTVSTDTAGLSPGASVRTVQWQTQLAAEHLGGSVHTHRCSANAGADLRIPDEWRPHCPRQGPCLSSYKRPLDSGERFLEPRALSKRKG